MCVCVCVWEMGQQWLGTSHWWSFKAYCYHCMQAKYQPAPDQTVRLSLWSWRWEDGIFIHQTYRALFKQRGSLTPWKCFVEIYQWNKFSLLSLLSITQVSLWWLHLNRELEVRSGRADGKLMQVSCCKASFFMAIFSRLPLEVFRHADHLGVSRFWGL